jgi:MFS family permease
MIFAPLINYLILSYGWRNAYLVIGILFLTVIIISSFIIKERATQGKVVTGQSGNMPTLVKTQGLSTRKALATPVFFGIAFINSAVLVAFHAVSVHLVPRAADVGISTMVSAAALGLMGGCSIPGRMLSGLLSEKIGWQRVLGLSCLGMALTVIWLLFLDEIWMLYCFVFLFGLFLGVRATSFMGIIGEFFGMRSLGALIGLTAAIGNLIGASAPFIAGFVFDTVGSYLIFFGIIMMLLLCAGLLSIIMHKPVESK